MKKNPKANTATRTTEVVACTSLREGVTTLRVSARTSLRKPVIFSQNPTTFPERFWTALGSCRLICAGRSSPFTVADFDAILPILHPPASCREILLAFSQFLTSLGTTTFGWLKTTDAKLAGA